jgi:trans-aconitate 2-methyltransferase
MISDIISGLTELKQVKTMYKWSAEQYESSSQNQKKWGADLVAMLDIAGNEKVLDIGCGDGRLTALIAEKLPDGFAVGIDSSADMIALSKKNFPPETFQNLRFMIKDTRELDFNDEFDIVFSNACLHWVIDHIPVLRGIRQSLKSGGRMLVQMGGEGNAAKIIEVVEQLMISPKWSGYFKNFTFPYGFHNLENYRKWLTALDFKINRVELVPKNMVQENKQGLTSWIRTTWLPYTQAVPEHLREEFIDELAEIYIRQNPVQSDGMVHVHMVRLEVDACKK